MGIIGHLVRIDRARLATFIARPDHAWDYLRELTSVEDAAEHLDLDKTWQGLCLLLHEHIDGPRRILLGGAKLAGASEQHVGTGPPRYSTPEQVKAAAVDLRALTEQSLRESFDAEEFVGQDVYPDIWSDGNEGIDYLMEYYPALVEFYAAAAASDQAVMLFLD
jgi:hypothetical protein